MRHWLLCLLLALGGCTSLPPPVADPEGVWQRYQRQLAAIDHWHLSGRIAIQTEDEGWSATIDWRQQAERYTIRLFGPLGQGSVLLQGDAGRVVLQSGDEPPVESDDPEWLLYRQLGWRVPVRALRYWARGLPAPGRVVGRRLNAQGYLAELEQAGWSITFHDYAPAGDGTTLPERVFIHNHKARVRLIVGRWEMARKDGAE